MYWPEDGRIKVATMRFGPLMTERFGNGLTAEEYMDYLRGQSQAFGRASFFASRWMLDGYPSISLGARLAASFAATRLAPEHASEVRMPWPRFWIDVPTGVIPVRLLNPGKPDDESWVTGVAVYSTDSGVMDVLTANTEQFVMFSSMSPASMADGHERAFQVLGEHDATESRVDELARQSRRVGEMVGRLVIGVANEMTLQHSTSIGRSLPPYKTDGRGVPKCYNFALKRDVKIDCRQSVRDYVEGRSPNTPNVQYLVRGFWRWQAYGPGYSLRRWVWIEPFWKGPDTAPIAVRSHDIPERPESP
jgi:hypothetical protein